MRVVRLLDDLGPANELGLDATFGRHIEPYTSTLAVTERCYQAANEIAAATDVTRLFRAGTACPELLSGPPSSERIFVPEIMQRIHLLG
jgi:hypothetical protein